MNAPKRFQVATLIAALIATIALVVAPALTVQAATKLAAPTGVKAQVTSSSASISWNKVSGASSYQICLLTNGSTTKCYRKSHKDSRTKVTFYNLKPTGGRDYFYKVYAYSGSKSSVSPKKSFDLASRPVSTSAT
ncbi:MAG: fibronectin type III domain-containing protein, partial [Propionibacteriales bacterium]|nr:fibronectin type III domain-containing protein [Propionibacteriales bacterium]